MGAATVLMGAATVESRGAACSPPVASYEVKQVPVVQAAPNRHRDLVPASFSGSNSFLRQSLVAHG